MDKHKKVGFLLHFDCKPSSIMHFLSISVSIKSSTRQQGNCPKCLLQPPLWWASIHDNTTCLDVITQTVMTKSASYVLQILLLSKRHIFIWEGSIIKCSTISQYYCGCSHIIIQTASVFVQPGWTQCFIFGELLCCGNKGKKRIFSHRWSF